MSKIYLLKSINLSDLYENINWSRINNNPITKYLCNNVGIGNTTPIYKLGVSVRAQRFAIVL
jgi:hypothetical protein